jgi:hypothetical protein
MFRERGLTEYVGDGYGGLHNVTYKRLKKDTNIKDVNDIKQEIWKIKRNIFLIEKTLKKSSSLDNTKLKQELEGLSNDLYFWQNEMSKFDNLQSHKSLKPHLRKRKEEELYNEIKNFILEAKKNNATFVSIEDISNLLKIDKKQLPKIFMKLNREGLISQAHHSFLHDSNRGDYLMTSSFNNRDNSDWYANIYYIL